MNMQSFFVLLIITALGIAFWHMISNKNKTQSNTKLQVIGWIPFWDQKNAFASFSSNVEMFDAISVFWYTCTPDGKVAVYQQAIEDQSIINFAKHHKVKILATVANLADYTEQETWDPQRVSNIISSKEKRDAHIDELMILVERKNFDGIVIDYETLPASQKENFSLFIETLAARLHQQNKLLGVAIHPKTSEDNPEEDNGSHAQDLQRIARAADQLYYMTYLEHGTFSQPGPPGGIEWIDNVLRYSIETLHIPKEKIFMGVGLMGVAWQQQPDGSFVGESNDNTFKKILSLTQEKAAPISWDSSSQTPYFSYQDESGNHEVWFENSHSFEIRAGHAHVLGIGGLALWRLGDEDEHIWEILEKKE